MELVFVGTLADGGEGLVAARAVCLWTGIWASDSVTGGLSGEFSNVVLPDENLFLDNDGGTLYAVDVPEPNCCVLAIVGRLVPTLLDRMIVVAILLGKDRATRKSEQVQMRTVT